MEMENDFRLKSPRFGVKMQLPFLPWKIQKPKSTSPLPTKGSSITMTTTMHRQWWSWRMEHVEEESGSTVHLMEIFSRIMSYFREDRFLMTFSFAIMHNLPARPASYFQKWHENLQSTKQIQIAGKCRRHFSGASLRPVWDSSWPLTRLLYKQERISSTSMDVPHAMTLNALWNCLFITCKYENNYATV